MELKSIITVKILALDYYTMKRISFTKKIVSDGLNFVDKITKPFLANGGTITIPSIKITAQESADIWLTSQNNILQELIDDPKRELHCILNWEVLKVENVNEDGIKSVTFDKKKPQHSPVVEETYKVTEALSVISSEKNPFDEKFKDDFWHTWKEMADSLKGVKTDKKISIVLSAMGVGFSAAATAYKHVTSILTNGRTEQEIKLLSQ